MRRSPSANRAVRRGFTVLAVGLLASTGCGHEQAPEAPAPSSTTTAVSTAPASAATGPHMPTDAEIPAGAQGDLVRRGREIVTRTHETLPDNAKNSLHCTSCHLEGGTKAGAAPWLGLVSVFPEYRARSGKEDTIEDRINDCFERSMNGKALDAKGTEMQAIVEYMRFISRDVPVHETPGRGFGRIEKPPQPDRARGAALYSQKCVACHGADATGLSPNGQYVFPPLAGAQSFNLGAGMARLDTAAAYIRGNMPLGQAGTLTDQEAYDIADYFIHLDRPDFAGRDRDWPQGGKPRDARY
jgi:thiosulfate dehydrogenase